MDRSAEKRTIRSMVVGAFVLLTGLFVVDVLPNMLKSLYAKQAEFLVFGYGVVVFTFMVIVLAVIGTAAVRDVYAMKDLLAFYWRPGEAYMSGKAKKNGKHQEEEKK